MAAPLDRLTLLETFVRISERGSITAAARDLGTSQATASRQLADLEQRLGATLVERTTHSLTLTETGFVVLAEARGMLSSWDGMAERIQQEKDELSGPIKVVVPIALGRTYLSERILSFARQHTEISINIVLDDEPPSITESAYDVLVKIGRPDDDNLIVQEIARVERHPVAARDFLRPKKKLTPELLRDLPFAALGPFEGAAIPLTGPKSQSKVLRLNPIWATNDIFALMDAILGGHAWGVLPMWLVAKELAQERLVRLSPGWAGPSLPITVSFHPSRRHIRRIRTVVKHLVESIRLLPGLERTEEASA